MRTTHRPTQSPARFRCCAPTAPIRWVMHADLLPLTSPPRLEPGARVALVAPSGPLRNVGELEHAVSNVRAFGWEPVPGPNVLARHGYFAGDDDARAGDLRDALQDTAIDGIWCVRGGYGATRLLPGLPIDTIRAHPKALIGYSDITALHSAWQQAGLVSFHAPTARAEIPPFSRDAFAAIMNAEQSAFFAHHMPNAMTLVPGQSAGRLAGGNLTLAASLCGTPWAIDFRDAIVVLEDINEATYRLERMLLQLRLAGAFDGCRGLLLGHFTDCPPESDDGARSLQTVAQEFADRIGVPAVLGAPVGHIANQWTLPLGSLATLDATACTLQLHR